MPAENYCRFLEVAQNAKEVEEKLGIKFPKSLESCLNCSSEKVDSCPCCISDLYEIHNSEVVAA